MRAAVKVMLARVRWVDVAIVCLAALLRLAWLDLRPAHFDEGVNGAFVDGMTSQGFYHYDPSNFHGPLHYYTLFVSQTLFGRNLWALRVPIALVSIACVVVVLAFRRFLPERACRVAALAMAVSPGMSYYGRDAIHETWLVFFLLLGAWGLAGLWMSGARKYLWAAALGVTGMVLTKETYIIHFIALLLTVPSLWLWERVSPSTPLPAAAQRWRGSDLAWAAAVSGALIVFFYTGGLLDWPPLAAPADGPRGSLAGLVETFGIWTQTGTGGHTGHEKPWSYWLQLLGGWYPTEPEARPVGEWPALVGLVASIFLLAPCSGRMARALAIYGTGALMAYTLIAYKTPWCLIAMMWPFHLLFGLAVHRAIDAVDPWFATAGAAVACAASLAAAWALNFRHFADETEPYAYVQTLPEIEKLLTPLRTLVAIDPVHYHLRGVVLAPDHHPLPWLLGDFTRVEMHGFPEDPEAPVEIPEGLADADFVLVDDTLALEVEATLAGSYFRQPLRIRGNAAESSVLFLRASAFGVCFPGREPEIQPANRTAAALPRR